jgi:hypothetical protein
MDEIIHAPKRYPMRITLIVVGVVILGTIITLSRIINTDPKIDYSKLSSPSSSERTAIDEAVASQAGASGVAAGTETFLKIDQFDGETAIGSVSFSNESRPKKYIAHLDKGNWVIVSYKDK